jgi:hypothetical protein
MNTIFWADCSRSLPDWRAKDMVILLLGLCCLDAVQEEGYK